ncbi:hypothetical protein [Actinopolymorpha sp. B9G3]|uniref:hypothetical protein n=1 Tax=Actinopolymorpha sp. B9G3 TaxID=3158970 RepID=UPI0032D973BB
MPPSVKHDYAEVGCRPGGMERSACGASEPVRVDLIDEHSLVTTMLDSGVDLRDVQIAVRRAVLASQQFCVVLPGRVAHRSHYQL